MKDWTVKTMSRNWTDNQKKAIEARNEYVELSGKINDLESVIGLYDKIDVRPLLEDLDKALLLKNQKILLFQSFIMAINMF